MTIRTHLKAGQIIANHNEAMLLRVRSTIKAGGSSMQHNEALRVRSSVKAGKAGGWDANHSEALRVHSTIKAGGMNMQHNETLRRTSDGPSISMRRQPRTASRKDDRLQLLVVRAGLRAGRSRLARERE
jgi:hypothetical protein